MLYAKIQSEIKNAMKEGNAAKRDCLRAVISRGRDTQKNQRHISDSDEISDDILIDAVQKEVKQLTKVINDFKDCQDAEFYQVSAEQLEILKEYLPKQMEQKEVEEAVAWILSKEDPIDFGKRMKLIMSELRNKADAKLIRKVVENYK